MTGWVYADPFCGSGAIPYALLSQLRMRHQLVPYQGSKWNVRKQVLGLFCRLGFWGEPDQVVLHDAAPWPVVHYMLLKSASVVLEELRPLVAAGEIDPEALYKRLHRATLPQTGAKLAAELLWLQRMSFSGKAVGFYDSPEGLRWLGCGLNTTSAHGTGPSETYGGVRPLGQALLSAVESLPHYPTVRSLWPGLREGLAEGLLARLPRDSRVLAYLDPPYRATTAYPCGHMDRGEVVALALELHCRGATVVISEGEPVTELGPDWTVEKIYDGRQTDSSFRRQGAEYVTYRRGTAEVR